MTDIHDIPFIDINIFISINGIDINNIKYIYDLAFKLMKDPTTSYKNVPISIIQWMKAHNLLINNVDVPNYTLNEIEQLDTEELSDLARLLTMKTTNIDSVINILTYMDKLYDDDIVLNNIVFPKDVAKIILNNSDYRTISSILSTSKNISKLLPDYTKKIFLGVLEIELHHVNKNKNKIVFDRVVYDFKIGDRIFSHVNEAPPFKNYTGKNYVVMSTTDTNAKIKRVDILGNIIDDKLIKIHIGIFDEYEWTNEKTTKIFSPGILLFDKGPLIHNLESPYLKYKTLPWDIETNNPELDMIVRVDYGSNFLSKFIFVITILTNDYMQLQYLGDNKNVSTLLEAHKIKEKWVIDNRNSLNSYHIRKIGGFINI
jgi:hypothetical protein